MADEPWKASWRRVQARTGQDIFEVAPGDRYFPVESAFDPAREGRRLAESLGDHRFYILVGALHTQLLASLGSLRPRSVILVLDPVKAWVDAGHSRLQTMTLGLDGLYMEACEVRTLASILAGRYSWALYGQAKLWISPVYQRLWPKLMDSWSKRIQETLARLFDDYRTQSHFGHVWLRNLGLNLLAPQDLGQARPSFSETSPEPAKGTLVVAGAGPGLEKLCPWLKNLKGPREIWCADTSRMTLEAWGIKPDMVCSLDASPRSRFHLYGLRHSPAFYALDPCADPAYARHNPHRFLASPHPLVRLLSADAGRNPAFSMGGNVGHAMVSLARLSSPYRRIAIWGIDFAYAAAKPYANPNFLYHEFHSLGTRKSPASMRLETLWLDDGTMHCDGIIETPRLEGYRQDLEAHLTETGARLVRDPGGSFQWLEGGGVNGNPWWTCPRDLEDRVNALEAWLHRRGEVPMADWAGLAYQVPGPDREMIQGILPGLAWIQRQSLLRGTQPTDTWDKDLARAMEMVSRTCTQIKDGLHGS